MQIEDWLEKHNVRESELDGLKIKFTSVGRGWRREALAMEGKVYTLEPVHTYGSFRFRFKTGSPTWPYCGLVTEILDHCEPERADFSMGIV